MTMEKVDLEFEEKELPVGWEWKRLGEVCQIFQGIGFPKNLQGNSHGTIPFFKVSDISENVINGSRYLETCNNHISADDLASLKGKLLPRGTVVFAKIGEGLKLNRRAVVKDKALIDNNVVGLKADEKKCLDPYLFFFLKTVKLEEFSQATTVPSVRKSDIENIPIPLPPLAEQQRIVAQIEALFSEMEAGKARILAAQQQLKTYRQSVLKWAFEGRLTREDVVDGELPEGWACSTLGDVIEKPKYGTSKKCSYDSIGVPVLRIPNIANGKVDSSDLKFAEFERNEIEAYKLREGDLLTIRSNGSVDLVGKCARITKADEKYLYAGYLIRLRPIQSLVDSNFLLLLVGSEQVRQQIEFKAKSTSGVNNINTEELRSLEIPLPPLEEQHRIVQEIESRLCQCDAMEAALQAALQQAEALRQSILKQAFEGKLIG